MNAFRVGDLVRSRAPTIFPFRMSVVAVLPTSVGNTEPRYELRFGTKGGNAGVFFEGELQPAEQLAKEFA